MAYINKVIIFCLIIKCYCTDENYEESNIFYETKQFQVPVDHFNFADNRTFNLRYLYNNSYAPVNDLSPLLFYTGNEGDIELFAKNTGFLWALAKELKAVAVFAEHRYYGKSLPFGTDTFNSTEHIGYLSVEQTLEDFAALIDFLVQGKEIPVITVGGSYGGMLAAWLRIKYPHLVSGALAASAPVWQFNGLAPCDIFYRITTSVFTSSYPNCSVNIRDSWNLFKALVETKDGVQELNTAFKFCTPVNQTNIDKFYDYLEDVYGNLAMVNYPYENEFLTPLPAYPVRHFCYILQEQKNGKDLLKAMQTAIGVYANYTGKIGCIDFSSSYGPNLGGMSWDIQTCNQMVMPMCSHINDTMFRNKEWNFASYSNNCFNKFKIRPKLNDLLVRYGGKNLRYASNIIFSNGLLDPWSGGGVLQNINDNIFAIIIPEGAHHLDLRYSSPSDPLSVKEARKQEKNIINQWIAEYFQQRKM